MSLSAQLTKPTIINEIHRRYFEAGADICETNTFSGTWVAQADYALEHMVYDINYKSAKLCKMAAMEVEKTTGRRRFCAGAIGPTNRTLSISPKVENAAFRNITFMELVGAYKDQVKGLVDGGCDLLFVETIFDTLNAKAALFAIDVFFEEYDVKMPVVISGTIVDMSGRTLSGQTTEAFWVSVSHAQPLCVGLNCALGPDQMRPFMTRLANCATCYTHAYPNAGLPNAMGGYDLGPKVRCRPATTSFVVGLCDCSGACSSCDSSCSRAATAVAYRCRKGMHAPTDFIMRTQHSFLLFRIWRRTFGRGRRMVWSTWWAAAAERHPTTSRPLQMRLRM